MNKAVWIVDFGSQYTQLITRRSREIGFSSEIITFETLEKRWEEYRANEKRLENMDTIDRQNGDDYSPDMSDQFRIPQPPPLGHPHPHFVCFPPGKTIKPSSLTTLVEKLARELNLKQPEKHPLIRGLRRGIGLYLYHLPLAYQQMVQQLAQEGVLGCVWSDMSLAYGVNMPFRTVVFCGDNPSLDCLVAKQMAGRAGRRGMDTQGSLVYYNLEWSKICQLNWGSMLNITGRDNSYPLIALQESIAPGTLHRTSRYPLIEFNSHRQEDADDKQSSFEVMVSNSRVSLEGLGFIISPGIPKHNFAELMWSLRQYPSEACMLWKLTNTIRRKFSIRRDERDDVKLMLLLLHICSRQPSSSTSPSPPSSTSPSPPSSPSPSPPSPSPSPSRAALPGLDTIYSGLQEEFDTIQESLPESLRLKHFGSTLDDSLYQIFRESRIPPEYSDERVDTIIRRLREVGEICRTYRNMIIHKTEYLQIEEIFRKTFRRIYYIIMAV